MKATILLCLVSFLIISCSKNEMNFQNGIKTGKRQALLPRDLSNPEVYMIKCKGDGQNGNECLFTISPPYTWGECNCEDGMLDVTLESLSIPDEFNQKEMLYRMFSGELFYSELVDFIKVKFNKESFGIQSIEYGVTSENYYLLYDLIMDNDTKETVMFVSLLDEENEPKKYRIDCNGSCSNPDETCRERFIFNPPSAQCTCESDNCQVEVIKLWSSQSLTADR